MATHKDTTMETLLNLKRLSNGAARRLIDGAEAKAREMKVPMCIAVVDESGTLIAFSRMDGGKTHSATVAQDKAWTAAVTRKSTAAYNEMCIPGNLVFGIHTAMGGRFSVVGGGLPVLVDGEVVGGIGVSSGTPEQDIACAQAGIDHLLG